MILEHFAGPGGWSTGIRMAGYTGPLVGVEHDLVACRTATAAGHCRICADTTTYPVEPFRGRVDGLVASPPCQPWSATGNRGAVADQPRIFRHLAAVTRAGCWIDYERTGWTDERSPLVLEVVRWIAGTMPRWVALEQVPAVAPFWRAVAVWLGTRGYRAWTGVLRSEEFGITGTCPLHEEEEWRAGTGSLVRPVWNAERLSQYSRKLGYVPSDAGTLVDSDLTSAALSVVINSAPQIASAFASGATCAERAAFLAAQLAHEAPPIQTGVAVERLTTAATCMFASATGTDENTASSLSSYLAARLLSAKSSTTSMAQLTTTIHRTLRCIAATLITGLRTGRANRTAGCGLCFDHATPQTRRRAILIARRDGRPAAAPTPTHQAYRPGQPTGGGLFDLPPWVSMAEALGWPEDVVVRSNYGTGGDARNRGLRRGSEPSATVTSHVDRNIVLRNGPQPHATDRGLDEPAATVYCSRPGNLQWVYERPATTVLGDARIGRPGHKHWDEGESHFAEQSVRVSVEEAGILQGFPADYPWQGTQSQRYRQVGDAVCPLLAAAIVRPLLTPEVAA